MSKTTHEATGDTAPATSGREPRTFRDPPTAGYVFGGFGVLGLVGVVVGLYQILTCRIGLDFLLARPDRLFEKGGIWVLLGLGCTLVFCVLPLLFGFETAVFDPVRRVVLRRRGLWVRLPERVVPFAVLERAEVGTGNAGRGGARKKYHFVRVVYRDGRSFRLAGLPGGRSEAEQAARLVNDMLRPVG